MSRLYARNDCPLITSQVTSEIIKGIITSKPSNTLQVPRLEDLSMFYAGTPDLYICAWLLENILEDVKCDLVCVVANSVNVLLYYIKHRSGI